MASNGLEPAVNEKETAETTETSMDASSSPSEGESAQKIPKLMDLEAAMRAPKLMTLHPTASAPVAPLARNGVPVGPPTAPFASNGAPAAAPAATTFDPSISLEHIRAIQHKFIDDRDWHRYHTPRNLLLAMVGEVGELSELFQWRGEVGVLLPDWSSEDKKNLRHELADVFLYLVRLSEQCGVDLPQAVLEKIALNEKKYPAEMVRGSSKKYYEYKQGTKLASPQPVSPSPDVPATSTATEEIKVEETPVTETEITP